MVPGKQACVILPDCVGKGIERQRKKGLERTECEYVVEHFPRLMALPNIAENISRSDLEPVHSAISMTEWIYSLTRTSEFLDSLPIFSTL